MGKMSAVAIEVDNKINRCDDDLENVAPYSPTWEGFVIKVMRQINSLERLVARLELEKKELEAKEYCACGWELVEDDINKFYPMCEGCYWKMVEKRSDYPYDYPHCENCGVDISYKQMWDVWDDINTPSWCRDCMKYGDLQDRKPKVAMIKT